MRRFHVVTAVGLAAVAACSSSNDAAPTKTSGVTSPDAGVVDASTPDPSGPSGLPCDVDAILAQNCRKCHSSPPKFGAPMALLTWDDMQKAPVSGLTDHVYQDVAQKVATNTGPMPPQPNPRLSAADQKVLADYAAAGAPKSNATCSPDPTKDDPSLTLNCTPDKTFAPASPYTMSADGDDVYVCWGADVTAATPTHIIGFAPHIDNTKIVHHVVMYESPTAYSTTPTPCDAGASLTWRMVLGWAPGVSGIELPPEAGFPISSSGTHYVVQVHYSNAQKLAGQTDASTIAVCTSPPRPNEADVLAFGTQNIDIPAAPPAGGVFTRDCTLTVPSIFSGLHLFTVLPHMHKLGVSMSTTLTPGAGGPAVDLGNDPSYDFSRQAWLPISATTATNDVIRTKCGWKNTTGEEVKFGQTTADEMCYSFTMYYPRINSALWSWATPSLTSQCTSEP